VTTPYEPKEHPWEYSSDPPEPNLRETPPEEPPDPTTSTIIQLSDGIFYQSLWPSEFAGRVERQWLLRDYQRPYPKAQQWVVKQTYCSFVIVVPVCMELNGTKSAPVTAYGECVTEGIVASLGLRNAFISLTPLVALFRQGNGAAWSSSNGLRSPLCSSFWNRSYKNLFPTSHG